MEIVFETKGIPELETYLGTLTDKIHVTFDEEAHTITEVIREASEPYVPYRTGELELSSNRNMVTDRLNVSEQVIEWAAYDRGYNYALVQEVKPFVHRIKPEPGTRTSARYAERGFIDSSERVKQLLIEIVEKALRS